MLIFLPNHYLKGDTTILMNRNLEIGGVRMNEKFFKISSNLLVNVMDVALPMFMLF